MLYYWFRQCELHYRPFLATVHLCAVQHCSPADALLPDLLVTWIFQVEVKLLSSSGQKVGWGEEGGILFSAAPQASKGFCPRGVAPVLVKQ